MACLVPHHGQITDYCILEMPFSSTKSSSTYLVLVRKKLVHDKLLETPPSNIVLKHFYSVVHRFGLFSNVVIFIRQYYNVLIC
jgi:hypothetical protein